MKEFNKFEMCLIKTFNFDVNDINIMSEQEKNWIQEWVDKVYNDPSKDEWIEINGIGWFKGLEIVSEENNKNNEINLKLKYDKWEKNVKELNLKQMLQIAHALGVDLFKAVMSHKLKDKKLPDEFYRNRFQDENDPIFEELVKLEYAVKTKWQDLPFYYVNDEGIKQFRKQYNELVEYKSPKHRDVEYLRKRINFYCDFYNYHFCDDNSDHIISAYLKYWINNHYVSHTTKDVIIKFKNELSSYYRKGMLNISKD